MKPPRALHHDDGRPAARRTGSSASRVKRDGPMGASAMYAEIEQIHAGTHLSAIFCDTSLRGRSMLTWSHRAAVLGGAPRASYQVPGWGLGFPKYRGGNANDRAEMAILGSHSSTTSHSGGAPRATPPQPVLVHVRPEPERATTTAAGYRCAVRAARRKSHILF